MRVTGRGPVDPASRRRTHGLSMPAAAPRRVLIISVLLYRVLPLAAATVLRAHGARSSVYRWPDRGLHAMRPPPVVMLTLADVDEGDLVEYTLSEAERASVDDGKRLGLGAVHDGRVLPLCKWSAESDEFLFDEDAEPLELDAATRVLDMSMVWLSMRLVGGGMGPGNPHGEVWARTRARARRHPADDAHLARDPRSVARL